jgi:hypothetical protein
MPVGGAVSAAFKERCRRLLKSFCARGKQNSANRGREIPLPQKAAALTEDAKAQGNWAVKLMLLVSS